MQNDEITPIPDPPYSESYKKLIQGNPFGGGLDSITREYMAGKNDPERLRELYDREPLTMRQALAKIKEWYPDDYIEIGKRFTSQLHAPDPYQNERDRNKQEAQRMLDQGQFGGEAALEALPNGIDFMELFEDFKPRKEFPAVKAAQLAVVNWLVNPAKGQCALIGAPGVGKTMLARAAACKLLESGINVVYRTEPQLIAEIRKSFDTRTTAKLMEQYAQVPWLIIDELGSASQTPTFQSIFDELIDIRWAHAGEVKTLYTTNLMAEQIPVRIASRIGDVHKGQLIVIEASDYRTDRNA